MLRNTKFNNHIFRLYLLTTFVVCLLPMNLIHAQTNNLIGGLQFHGAESTYEKRTGFQFPEEGNELTIDKDLSIQMNLSLLNKKQKFGYVTRIIINQKQSVDVLIHYSNGHASVHIVSDGKTRFKFPIKALEGKGIQKNNVAIKLISALDSVEIVYRKNKMRIPMQLHKRDKVILAFGKNSIPTFQTTDVAPIILHSLKISKNQNRTNWFWNFRLHDGNKAIDTIQHEKLTIENPIWIIDQHSKWKKIISKAFQQDFHIVHVNNDSMYVVMRKKIQLYGLNGHLIREWTIQRPLYDMYIANQFYYDKVNNRLSYFNTDNISVENAYFDEITSSWVYLRKLSRKKPVGAHYSKSNKIIDTTRGTFMQIFGYGQHHYNSTLFVQSLMDASQTKRYNLSGKIPPRYQSAVAYADSVIYIYGGIGNESGRQELGIHVYNDFYAHHLDKNYTKLLWTKSTEKPELVSDKLLLESGDSTALCLCYNPMVYQSYLLLKRMSLNDGNMVPLVDSIPYRFHDIHSFASLIWNKRDQKLYTVVKELCEDESSQLSIYEISLPVVPIPVLNVKKETGGYTGQILLGVFIILFCVVILVSIRLTKRRKASKKANQNINNSMEVSVPPAQKSKEDFLSQWIEASHYVENEKRKPGIYLLSGFQIINNEGEDITGSFTPIMKHLLVLIILHTMKNDTGISSTKLHEILWFDKSEQSARNNRGVNLRKIRKVLENIGDMTISSKNSYWRFNLEEGDYCDIMEANQFLLSCEKANELSDTDIKYLLVLTQKGHLLPNINEEFLDPFKSDYTSSIMNVLGKQLHRDIPAATQVAIADSMLKFDDIDEVAAKIKCKALIALGKHGQAKAAYNHFNKTYQNCMGSNYEEDFDVFIE